MNEPRDPKSRLTRVRARATPIDGSYVEKDLGRTSEHIVGLTRIEELRYTTAVVLALIITVHVHADDHNVGWFFSRANCLGFNESITWKAVPLVKIVGRTILPSGQGVPAWRRSIGEHDFKYSTASDHVVESASELVWTWRAHAGHFPIPESFPYMSVVWVRKEIPSIGIRRDAEGRRWVGVIYVTIWVPSYIVDNRPWIVNGWHFEDIGDGELVSRTSSATGCNWEDTFNSMRGD